MTVVKNVTVVIYVDSLTLYKDLNIMTIPGQVSTFYKRYYKKIRLHSNQMISNLSSLDLINTVRYLKNIYIYFRDLLTYPIT